ncbi:MAG: hypothetical protein ACRDKH_06605 [Solirubrobacterales bacterium]
MLRDRRNNAARLRSSVEALPNHTKRAMLDGIQRNRVIVGAYVDKRGGVCPMLAAHRNGGRTDFGSFARAWDAFTGAKKPRRASAREVRTLRGYLEVALIRDGIPPPGVTASSPWAERPLADEVRDVQATRRRLAESEALESEVTVEELLIGAERELERERARADREEPTEETLANELAGIPTGSPGPTGPAWT